MDAAAATSVTVMGMGNWGCSLAAALAGVPGLLHARVHASPQRRATHPRLQSRVLWLCVPDAAIAGTVTWLLRHNGDLRGKTVVHSSGALDRSVLAAAERAGARTASAHPMMSFPTRRPAPLAGTRFGIDTGHAATQRELFRLVRRLGGRPFAVQGAGKAIYHAGAMCGSPLLVALLAAGVDCMREAGIGERDALSLLGPMAAATIANVQRQGLAKSFSGPLARGDAATVKLHRQALAGHPLMAPVYDSLARLALKDLPCGDPAALGAVLHGRPPMGRPRRRKN